ncbi:DUF2922 domain-containing protein [Evansella tamaricis]|uniref:DUF2922 domain-containing protein n=1 Tax=Evansella tamaricis TaxID=2069301 RepID=A0ABS6JCP0_9BACI|nr:DUF2922 domain-containing protein [Evansella tamaricis]MBU9711434.1 DUF2922 domain-containing protein [Evansella tamaricis]
MSKRLELLFTNEGGKSVTISLDDPIEPVDEQIISKVMDDIISYNVFISHDGQLVGKRGARVVSRTVEQIEL